MCFSSIHPLSDSSEELISHISINEYAVQQSTGAYWRVLSCANLPRVALGATTLRHGMPYVTSTNTFTPHPLAPNSSLTPICFNLQARSCAQDSSPHDSIWTALCCSLTLPCDPVFWASPHIADEAMADKSKQYVLFLRFKLLPVAFAASLHCLLYVGTVQDYPQLFEMTRGSL
jgi:hypothetical protein